MKTLNNYIMERIRVDNIKSKPHDFPFTGTIDDVRRFLLDAGFTEMTDKKFKHMLLTDFADEFPKLGIKGFVIKDKLTIIFADTSNDPHITHENPVFGMYWGGDIKYSEAFYKLVHNRNLNDFKKDVENYFNNLWRP